MSVVFAFLAGMSFVIALIAVVIAIAEHYRAERVEKVLLDAVETFTRLIAAQSQQLEDLRKEDGALDQTIRAVAAASVLPSIPASGKVHIVVPGPGTKQ